jgi:hypothetical protein
LVRISIRVCVEGTTLAVSELGYNINIYFSHISRKKIADKTKHEENVWLRESIENKHSKKKKSCW